MKAVSIAIASVVCVLVLFRFLTFLSKRRNRLTPGQVADAIEKHLEGIDGPYDWDDFTSIPIADDHLDAIRLRCTEVGGAPASEGTLKELRDIVAQLRSLAARRN